MRSTGYNAALIRTNHGRGLDEVMPNKIYLN